MRDGVKRRGAAAANSENHLTSPELVICVSHLVSPQLGHQDFDDVDEDQEVDLGETHRHLILFLF